MSDSNSFKDIQNFLNTQQENKGFDSSSNSEDHLIEKLWSLSDDALSSPDFDTEQAWNKFRSSNHISSGTNYKKILTISAIIIAVLFSLYLLFNNSNENPGYSPAIASQFSIEENLKDGSLMALVSSADLQLDPEFSVSKRKVTLTGNAYCNIQSDPDHPFEIITDHGVIKVFGTSFLVEQEKGTLHVSVFEGIVEVLHPTLSSLSCRVKEGQKATLFNNEQAILLSELSSQEMTLQLSNTKVSDAVRLLDQYYPPKIRLESNFTGKECRITSRWNPSAPNEWQEELSLLFNAKIAHEKGEILVSGLNCED